jgi:hypothetical protein
MNNNVNFLKLNKLKVFLIIFNECDNFISYLDIKALLKAIFVNYVI